MRRNQISVTSCNTTAAQPDHHMLFQRRGHTIKYPRPHRGGRPGMPREEDMFPGKHQPNIHTANSNLRHKDRARQTLMTGVMINGVDCEELWYYGVLCKWHTSRFEWKGQRRNHMIHGQDSRRRPTTGVERIVGSARR